MTPHELAVLPVGTRVRFDLRVDENDAPAYDHGTVRAAGVTCSIEWDAQRGVSPVTSIIDTRSVHWKHFITDLALEM